MLIKQNTAKTISATVVVFTGSGSSSDAGCTTVNISKAGAAYAAAAGTLNNLGNGFYSVALTSGDTDTLGSLAIQLINSTNAYACGDHQIVAVDVEDASSLGLSNLDAQVSTRGTSNYAGGAVASVSGDITGKVLGSGASAFVGDGAQVTASISGTVQLAATQPYYAPAVAGDAMTLEFAERLAIAIQNWQLNDGIELGLTPQNALRCMFAVLAGKSNVHPPFVDFRNFGDTINRVTVQYDGTNQRVIVSYDFS